MSSDRPPDDGIFRAAVTSSGLSMSFRSRAVSALDRLVGALVRIPAARLEAVEKRIRNQASRESAVQHAAATRLVTAILEDYDVRPGVADLAVSPPPRPRFRVVPEPLPDERRSFQPVRIGDVRGRGREHFADPRHALDGRRPRRRGVLLDRRQPRHREHGAVAGRTGVDTMRLRNADHERACRIPTRQQLHSAVASEHQG